MKKKGQLIAGLVVLFPLVFFLTMAMGSNNMAIAEDTLVIEGAGGLDIPLNEISKTELIDSLPEMTNAGSFSLGLVKKGNFQRVNDAEIVRVIKNNSTTWIHLFTDRQEVYFNLSADKDTEKFYKELETVLTKE
ncbi:hypothetical protein [Owenweeksia hongkongensis]|uniref:hypothetical protein n=1 Tax=Owenweeksia hongkongensis TaxID=253245 RepID=UPI003A904CE3